MCTNAKKPREACGVFGVCAPGEDVARITYFGLYALQHRGQESAGIATADGQRLSVYTHMGLVSQVFNEPDLARLKGHIAIGHNRYSTTGSSHEVNAQPLLVEGSAGKVAIAHNGNLVNHVHLRQELEEQGVHFSTSTDTEVIAHLIANSPGRDWVDRIRNAMPRLSGAYSVVLMTEHQLFAVRDPLGVRPLALGRHNGHWVVASESCALDTVGAEFIREVQPGEIVSIDQEGLDTNVGLPCRRRGLCIFEYIYFARPDSVINGRLLYLARQEMGRQLAREHPVKADLVIAVPDSATPAGIGYAQEAGIRFSEGLIKSRYIGRTFIQPDQHIRDVGINLKFNPLPEVLSGKRVIVVDDSIVRGTTTRPIVNLLRQAGARQVHVRIHAPPMRFPCVLGVDTARKSELIAARMTVPEIEKHIGADSLGYLGLDRLVQAVNLPQDSFCLACFTGDYPVPVQLELDKLALERQSQPDETDTASDSPSDSVIEVS
ncbi:MAG: amidophosphoribosyltransferase [Actinobacteria bacterium]|nr:amidophosphoribosyltransferase [Actinomycetota bacterium]